MVRTTRFGGRLAIANTITAAALSSTALCYKGNGHSVEQMGQTLTV